jgi:tRNA nucleotidyltransferase (CCA-adding enzyme)
MSFGADLDVVQQFYQSYLDEDQRSLFMQLLGNLQDREINGFRISFALAEVDDYIPEIALITHKLRDAENLNVLITLVEMGDRVQVVLRSRVDQVDVGELARAFGGGGHPRASSVTMKEYSLETAREAIERWLLENLQSGLRARDLMSSPVHTVRPDLSLEEAQRVMLRLGHGGMPVVDEDEQLVGVITRHDVDQAMEHELMHAPVKGFMNPDVITADPEDGLMELKNRIIHNQVGRLPVVKGEHLLGIVTRSDIIRALHDQEMGEHGDGEFENVRSRAEDVSVNVEPRVKNHFDEEGLKALRRWGNVVNGWNGSLFLVG